MAWNTGRMVSTQQMANDPTRRTIQQVTNAAAAAPTTFGSNIVMPTASPSSNAIAGFANLAPQVPGAPAVLTTPMAPVTPQATAPAVPGAAGGGSEVNPYGGNPSGVPYSPAALAAGTTGDIYSNPAFANFMATQHGGTIGGSSYMPPKLDLDPGPMRGHGGHPAATPEEAQLRLARAMQQREMASSRIGGANWGAGVGQLGQP